MGRVKTLAENTLIFAICNFTSKLLVFFMLPFYTSVLSKEEFGTADMITTIVGLLYPVFTVSIANGCMRYALDKNVDTKKVFSIGFIITVFGAIAVIVLSPLLSTFSFLHEHLLVFVCLYITTIFQHLFSLFARGIERVRLVGVAGVSSSFTGVSCNLLFLYVFHFGVEGYIWSIVISNVISILILFIGANMKRFFTREIDGQLAREMLQYTLPLMPNSLSWWINHAANRYILNYYCGVADVGLYSAASKMPSMIDTFRGIFIQAWQLSTITEYEKKDSASFFKGMYQAYHLFLIILTSVLIIFSQILGKILYSSDFYEAWKITPLLFSGVMFGSLIAYYSPTYLAHKRTKILFYSTFLGAIITIALNFILIPVIGIVGTAVTSVASNFIIYIFLHIDSRKYQEFKINNIPFYASYCIIVIQAVVISFGGQPPVGFFSLLCMLIIVGINVKTIRAILIIFLGAIKNKKNERKIEKFN